MKKPVILLALGIIILASCKKLEEIAQNATTIDKNVDYNEEIEIPNVPQLAPLPPGGVKLPFPKIGAPTYIQDFVAKNNTTADLILSVNVNNIGIKLIQPDSSKFDYVDSLWIFISTKTKPEILAAYKYGIGKGLKDIPADVVSQDIKEYFKEDSIYYTVKGHYNDWPDSNTKLQLYGSFKVKASPVKTNN
ncbi:MAG TPA: hypothetical protein VK167_14805 [Flavipsychrobacter sp.]|nr:hypothetical protein [Flavipsychrobacter sp.]